MSIKQQLQVEKHKAMAFLTSWQYLKLLIEITLSLGDEHKSIGWFIQATKEGSKRNVNVFKTKERIDHKERWWASSFSCNCHNNNAFLFYLNFLCYLKQISLRQRNNKMINCIIVFFSCLLFIISFQQNVISKSQVFLSDSLSARTSSSRIGF